MDSNLKDSKTNGNGQELMIGKVDALPSDVRAGMLQSETSVWLNVAKFEQMSRVANMLSKATFIPDAFRNKPADCLIALDLSSRMGVNTIMLMQSMYVVHGKPGFEGKLASALINASKRYENNLQYEWQSEDKPKTATWGCRAWAVRKSDNLKVYGPWVTWEMVQAEGWHKPKGQTKSGSPVPSKWVTMPELMFHYRAASFFLKVHDSDLFMGMQTVEELEDMTHTMVQQPDGSFASGDGEKTAELYNVTQQAPEQEKKPNEDHEQPQTEAKQPIDWNPIESPVQQRYNADKANILIQVANKNNIYIEGKTSKEIHEAILELTHIKSEGFSESQEVEKGTDEGQLEDEFVIREKYNVLKSTASRAAIEHANIKLDLDKNALGMFNEPKIEQMQEWCFEIEEYQKNIE